MTVAAASPTVVLVHGAFTDASCWFGVAAELLEAGVDVCAPPNPLRGPLPDAAYLANRRVHVTTQTSLRLPVLPRVHTVVGVEQHFVNVVLLAGTGHRIRELAWYRPLTTRLKPGS